MQRIPSFFSLKIMRIMLFLSIFLCAVFAEADNDFSFVTPMPTGNKIHDAWPADDHTFFFVGDGGTILKYSNNGWETMETPTESALFGIHGTSINDIWAVGGNSYGETDGEKSVVLHYNGISWSSVTPPADLVGDYHVMQDVYAAGPDNVWGIAASSSYLCHFDGTNWEFVDSGIATTLPYDFHAIHGFAADDIYVVGGCDTIIHYDGLNWTKEYQVPACNPSLTENLLYDVWGFAASSVYTCGNGGQILARENSDPASWTQIHASGGIMYGTSLNGIGGAAGDGIYFVGNDGVIWKYADGVFTTVADSGPSTFHTIISRSAGDYIIAGTHGTTNSFDGMDQTPLNTPVSLNMDFKFSTYAGNTLWLSPSILTDVQGVYTFDRGSFTEHNLSLDTEIQAQVSTFRGISEVDIWLGAQVNLGIIKRYNGSTWADYTPPGRIDNPILLDVLKSSSGSYFVILARVDGSGQQQACKVLENTTECFNNASGTNLYAALTEADDGTIYAAGARGTVVSYSNGSWSEETTGLDIETNLVGIAAGGGWVYAVGSDRTVIYKQSGHAWQPVEGLTTRTGNTFLDVVYGGSGISYATLQTPSQYIGGGKGYIYALQNGVATIDVGGSSMFFNDLATNEAGKVIAVGNSGMLFGMGIDNSPLPTLEDVIMILQVLSNMTPAEPDFLDMTGNNKADMGDVIAILQALIL